MYPLFFTGNQSMPQSSRPAVLGLSVPVLLTTGLAIASLVLGFLGLLTGRSITGGLFVILGVMGIAALIQVAQPSRLTRATLYTIIGLLFLGVLILIVGNIITARAKPAQEDR